SHGASDLGAARLVREKRIEAHREELRLGRLPRGVAALEHDEPAAHDSPVSVSSLATFLAAAFFAAAFLAGAFFAAAFLAGAFFAAAFLAGAFLAAAFFLVARFLTGPRARRSASSSAARS